jgi:hypothetical protein
MARTLRLDVFRQQFKPVSESEWDPAWRMFLCGFKAHVLRDEKALEAAYEWAARERGFAGPDSDVPLILNTVRNVKTLLCAVQNFPHGTDDEVEDFRAALAEQFGRGAPSARDIKDWIGRYEPRQKKGKLTLIGIATKILHRVIGTRNDEESHIRDRVRRALERDEDPPRE